MTQRQREALFDLILLSCYADNHISLEEEMLMQSAFIAEGWESELPKELYLEKSLPKARAASESDAAMAAFVAEHAAVFTDANSQREVFNVLKTLLERDGLAKGDSEFLALVQRSLPRVS